MKKTAAIVIFITLFTYNLFAEKTGINTHDGFFLRLSGGFGYTQTEIDALKDIKIKGVSNTYSFAIGYAVIENLIVEAEIFGSHTSDPDLSPSGKFYENDLNAISNGFGIGATYYLMPINIYASASVGFSRVILNLDDSGLFDDGSEQIKSEGGVGFSITVGKEWWVSDNWGLGVAGQFVYVYAKMKEEQEIPQSKETDSLSVGLLLSATYN